VLGNSGLLIINRYIERFAMQEVIEVEKWLDTNKDFILVLLGKSSYSFSDNLKQKHTGDL
jgi:hypothetical protein